MLTQVECSFADKSTSAHPLVKQQECLNMPQLIKINSDKLLLSILLATSKKPLTWQTLYEVFVHKLPQPLSEL